MRRIAAKNLLSVGALLAVGACASTINPDAPQGANAALAAMERASPTTESESGATEQLERLWHGSTWRCFTINRSSEYA